MAEINEVIHQSVRLKIMASLAALDSGDEVEFVFLRDQLGLTSGNLGAHVDKLVAAGYVRVRKAFVVRRPCTFIRPTRKGVRAFEDHVAALRGIVGLGE